MDNQGQNDQNHSTNNDPFSPVSEVTDSVSHMSVSYGVYVDRLQESVIEFQEELLSNININAQSNEPQSVEGQGDILDTAINYAQIPDERARQSTVFSSGQQYYPDQPNYEPQIAITNQPLPNDFKFR